MDPTAGSFNSIKVAKSLGLSGIGIEKDEGFFKKAKAALEPETAPGTPPVNTVSFD
jgi:hypothetical protein